jgi:hypothetical protein
MLIVDSTDVTSSSTVTSSVVTYIPTLLSEGIHNIHLEVRDNSADQNKAVKTWWFVVDSLAPTISNVRPVDNSIIGTKSPEIGMDYNDDSGIDMSSIVMNVDGINVTSATDMDINGISYTPIVPLSEDNHEVYIKVGDNSTPRNTAEITFSFTVDVTPPSISNIQPANGSVISDSTPVISAIIGDNLGINLSSIVFKIDGVDIASYATANQTHLNFTPQAPLQDGTHDIYLKVSDMAIPKNSAVETWTFTIDTTAPVILHQPINNGDGGRDITITATVTDAGNLNSVALYYKKPGGEPFTKIEMSRTSGNLFTGTIPGSSVTSEGLQYYIEAIDWANNTARSPDSNWLESPHTIEVQSLPWMFIILGLIIIILIVSILVAMLLPKKKSRDISKKDEEKTTEDEDDGEEYEDSSEIEDEPESEESLESETMEKD